MVEFLRDTQRSVYFIWSLILGAMICLFLDKIQRTFQWKKNHGDGRIKIVSSDSYVKPVSYTRI